MNILITGGAGFIGRKTAYHFKNLGHNVIIIDFNRKIILDGIRTNKITESLENDFKCYGFDISDSENFNQIKENIDTIIHIAGQSGGYGSLKNPELDCDWNCKGTLNTVNFAKRKKIKKVIYISSMAVYGEGSFFTEIDNTNPISYYGVSKLTGEYYVKTLNQNNIPFTILRLFNTYGVGQDMDNLKQGMLSIYLSQALKNGKIEVTGTLNRYRDFIHVDDVVSAIELSLNSITDNQTYNVCSARETTVNELLIMINDLFDEKIEIIELSNYEGDQFGNSGSNEKLKLTGLWEPKMLLEKGLKKFYEEEIKKRKITSNYSC